MRKFWFLCYQRVKWMPDIRLFYTLRYAFARRFLRSCGRNVSIGQGVYLPFECSIGDNVILSPRTILEPKVYIGSNVMIGHEALFMTASKHHLGIPEDKIVVKDGTWIGTRSIILQGVTIGSHSVIGAGAVVTKDIPDNVMAAGNPAVIKKEMRGA